MPIYKMSYRPSYQIVTYKKRGPVLVERVEAEHPDQAIDRLRVLLIGRREPLIDEDGRFLGSAVEVVDLSIVEIAANA